jgi:hypothetical protein
VNGEVGVRATGTKKEPKPDTPQKKTCQELGRWNPAPHRDRRESTHLKTPIKAEKVEKSRVLNFG